MMIDGARKVVHGVRSAVAFFRLIEDPDRLDEVFELVEGLDRVQPAMVERMVEAFRREEIGAAALAQRPRLGLPDMVALGQLPRGTLGREFAEHMRRNGLDPAALPQRPSEDELSYALAHLYETHDLWHVLTGFDTDVAGELGLQAFYLGQVEGKLGLMLIAMGLLNSARDPGAYEDRGRRMDAIARSWQLSRKARPLFGIRWQDQWHRPPHQIQAELRLPLTQADALSSAA
jgi:ubiquinone biosynthesis protein Coq4